MCLSSTTSAYKDPVKENTTPNTAPVVDIKVIVIGVVIGAVCIVLLVLAVWWCLRSRPETMDAATADDHELDILNVKDN